MKTPAPKLRRGLGIGCGIMATIAVISVPLALHWAINNVDPCESMILQEVVSPQGGYTATLITRGCGATTGDYLQIILRDTAHKFAVDDYLKDENDVVFVMDDKNEQPTLTWQTEGSLQVGALSHPGKIYQHDTHWHQVLIGYK